MMIINTMPREGCEVLWWVCLLFVCLFVGLYMSVQSHNSKTTRPNFTDFVHVACDRGPVLLWRHCNTLCTSGLLDDVIFSYHGANGPVSSTILCLEEFTRWRYQLDVRQLQCLIEFVRVWHRGRSLLSTIALLLLGRIACKRCVDAVCCCIVGHRTTVNCAKTAERIEMAFGADSSGPKESCRPIRREWRCHGREIRGGSMKKYLGGLAPHHLGGNNG